ncbi:Retrovirus-related Pol polyprotein from transposon RE1 [Vitis vinifera]|uniref:Retrovirus-related Pol polyprotein from transposon RE1 n=1 Tax=Vitis vinifera TaxID=29760 RepID=A0A438C893_VITVI|nr:Retrovirus-related Pol polyprotein from transposon RE1 [Vitis vinifera]
MHSEFAMSMMRELKFFLGLQIKQLKEGTFINQAKYIRDLLKRFNMEEAKTMKTPMSSSIRLDMDEKGKPVNSTMYRGMIESHLSAVKRILRYLKGTMDIGLWYPKGDKFELIGYSDADIAGCKVERKSTSGTCHFLGHSLVSWHSKKQNSVALSTTKTEYIAVGLVQLHLYAPRALGWCLLLLVLFHSPFGLLLFSSIRWMAPRRETGTSRAQGKCLAKPFHPEQTEARERLGRSVNFSQLQHFRFEGLFGRMGWLPVVTIFEPIFSTLGMGKPSAHNLTVPNRVLHHMTCSILLPRGGHRDEVSYLEAFIMDSIFTGRRIHVGYLMMMHMISCVESTTQVIPYDCFLTRVFKDARVDLSRETDFEAPTSYDMYDEQSLGRMKFEKAPDDSWIRRAERQAQDQG